VIEDVCKKYACACTVKTATKAAAGRVFIGAGDRQQSGRSLASAPAGEDPPAVRVEIADQTMAAGCGSRRTARSAVWPFEKGNGEFGGDMVGAPRFEKCDELAQPPVVFAQSISKTWRRPMYSADLFADLSSRTSWPRLSEVSQRTKVHVGVDPCCICLPVTQHFTDFTQRCSAAEHLGCQRMAE